MGKLYIGYMPKLLLMENKSYRRRIIRGFELISEELTLISDADSDMEKVIKISPRPTMGKIGKKKLNPCR